MKPAVPGLRAADRTKPRPVTEARFSRQRAPFSETDLTEDLKKIDVPTLIIHGDDDQIVPIGAAALQCSRHNPTAAGVAPD